MLLPSPLLRSHLITESTLQTTAIFFFILQKQKSRRALSACSPHALIPALHFTHYALIFPAKQELGRPAHRPSSFPSEARHQTRQKVRRNFQADRGIERATLFSLPAALFSHQSPLHTNTGALVLTYWNGRRSNGRLIIPSQHCLPPSLFIFFFPHIFLHQATRNIHIMVQTLLFTTCAN